mgnify:CR=1 FL=1
MRRGDAKECGNLGCWRGAHFEEEAEAPSCTQREDASHQNGEHVDIQKCALRSDPYSRNFACTAHAHAHVHVTCAYMCMCMHMSISMSMSMSMCVPDRE